MSGDHAMVTGRVEETAITEQRAPWTGYSAHITRWFLASGLLLFFVLVWRAGPSAIGQLLWKTGWALPLVFVPYALIIGFETLGWWFAFQSSRVVRFTDLLRLTIATKAVQLLTPAITQAGEFMKVHL